MALSTKKKNIVLAMWKTGKFRSFTSIAKHYKISPKTAQKIIGDTAHSNEDAVNLFTQVEHIKKSSKNPHEIKAIESVAKERTIADQIEDEVLGATLANVKGIKKVLDSGKVAKVVTEGQGMGTSMSRAVEFDMGPEHYKAAQEGLDKALITAGKAARHAPKGDVNVNNTENNIRATIEYITHMPQEDKIEDIEFIEVNEVADEEE